MSKPASSLRIGFHETRRTICRAKSAPSRIGPNPRSGDRLGDDLPRHEFRSYSGSGSLVCLVRVDWCRSILWIKWIPDRRSASKTMVNRPRPRLQKVFPTAPLEDVARLRCNHDNLLYITDPSRETDNTAFLAICYVHRKPFLRCRAEGILSCLVSLCRGTVLPRLPSDCGASRTAPYPPTSGPYVCSHCHQRHADPGRPMAFQSWRLSLRGYGRHKRSSVHGFHILPYLESFRWNTSRRAGCYHQAIPAERLAPDCISP